MKSSLVHLVTRRNIARNAAFAATTLALLAAISAPSHAARLNPQPLPPGMGNAIHQPYQASPFDMSSVLKGFVGFFTNIIIVGGKK